MSTKQKQMVDRIYFILVFVVFATTLGKSAQSSSMESLSSNDVVSLEMHLNKAFVKEFEVLDKEVYEYTPSLQAFTDHNSELEDNALELRKLIFRRPRDADRRLRHKSD